MAPPVKQLSCLLPRLTIALVEGFVVRRTVHHKGASLPRRRLALLLVSLALLSACGGDDDDDSSDDGAVEATVTTGDAAEADCRVTVDEASAAVGLPLEEADDVIESDGGTSCSWAYRNEESTATVDVTWYDGNGADATEDAGAAWSDRAEVSVEGADEALWSAENSGLLARSGDDAIRVFVSGPDVILDDPQGAAIAIAQVAFGEMEQPDE